MHKCMQQKKKQTKAVFPPKRHEYAYEWGGKNTISFGIKCAFFHLKWVENKNFPTQAQTDIQYSITI